MATTQTPMVPPRPTRQDNPKVPPRPIRRAVNRSISPSRDRFAPSPLDSLLSKSPRGTFGSNGPSLLSADPIDRTASVDLPSVGQEGMEYEAVAEELSASKSQAGSSRSASPEHTRTIGNDVKLHAPKPSLPAISAKQRVAAVTRTDSDRAASFGIGQPSSDSYQKKGSTTSQELSSAEDALEDEHGIPEIGRQVPMYPNAGDVQAPTPGIDAGASDGVKHHSRKKSARGFGDLPPGSYGLHGHGVIPSDKLEQAYYGKHPDLVKKERTSHHADRAKDFSLPSADLEKIVHDTASRGFGIAAHDLTGTPSEQVGWQAIEESVSRPASVAPKFKPSSFGSQSSYTQKAVEISVSPPDADPVVIHVDDPSNRRKSVMFSDSESPELEYESEAPILAEDEVAKNPTSLFEFQPAVEPPVERRLSSFDGEEGSSRPSSRPASIYRVSQAPDESAIIEDKAEEEYEPLFKDDGKKAGKAQSTKSFTGDDTPNRFPSRDIWEDAPESAHYTAEVSTPEVPVPAEGEGEESSGRPVAETPSRDGETPAQAFARHQEELAETELQGAETFYDNRQQSTPVSWIASQSTERKPAAYTGPGVSLLTSSLKGRPPMAQRFPSRDIWEDAPESLQLQTVVSNPQQEETASPAEASKPEIPQRPVRKMTDPSEKSEKAAAPYVPSRPKPKPVVPARPVKQQAPASTDEEPDPVPRAKPAIPARPFGGKIAQLQANFMSDLNKKLKIGPQAPKKEEPAEPAEEAPEVEKAPLVDARKGRARGPQRRAPRSSPSPAAAVASASSAAPVSLGFSTTMTLFSIDPEEGVLSVSRDKAVPTIPEVEAGPEEEAKPEEAEEAEKAEPAVAETATEAATETEAEASPIDDKAEPAAADDAAAKE